MNEFQPFVPHDLYQQLREQGLTAEQEMLVDELERRMIVLLAKWFALEHGDTRVEAALKGACRRLRLVNDV